MYYDINIFYSLFLALSVVFLSHDLSIVIFSTKNQMKINQQQPNRTKVAPKLNVEQVTQIRV